MGQRKRIFDGDEALCNEGRHVVLFVGGASMRWKLVFPVGIVKWNNVGMTS